MTDAVGLNTNYSLGTSNLTTLGTNNIGTTLGTTTSSTNSIFNMNNSLNNNYSDDMFMNSIDFNALAQSLGTTTQAGNQAVATTQTQQQAQTQNQTPSQLTSLNQTETSFTSNPQTTNETLQTKELENYLVNKDKNLVKTEAGNTYSKSGKFKFLGAIAGLLAPVASAAIDLFKGKGFKEAFKIKQLAITCPIIALTGFGAGMLLDGLVNSGRAKEADNTNAKLEKVA
jgi:hypothetical protein